MKIHPDVYRFMFTGLGLFSLVLLFFSFDCAERRGCFKNPPLVLGCKEDCA